MLDKVLFWRSFSKVVLGVEEDYTIEEGILFRKTFSR